MIIQHEKKMIFTNTYPLSSTYNPPKNSKNVLYIPITRLQDDGLCGEKV